MVACLGVYICSDYFCVDLSSFAGHSFIFGLRACRWSRVAMEQVEVGSGVLDGRVICAKVV